MEDLPLVGLYTLNGCTYVVLKQTLGNGGGELHLRMENFSGLMTLMRGLESELLKNQNLITTTNDDVSYDPNVLLDGMFDSMTSGEEYNPANEPSITYNPSPIDTDIPKKTRKRRSDAGIKKPH